MIAHAMAVVKKLNKLSIIVIIMFTILITGCATVQTSQLTTRSDYKKVWNACIDSLPDVRFSVSSTDAASGLIIADQAVVSGHGTVSRLNIRVSRGSGNTIVVVKYVPPPGTIGGYGTADRYVAALKQKIPDLEPMIDNNEGKTAKTSQQGKKEMDDASVGSQQENTKEMTPKSSQKSMTNDNVLVSYLIVTKKSKIRAEDNTKSKVITTAKAGEKVEKIDASDNWFQVRTAKGKSGWIMKSAVKQAE
jgi:hypothetical protein